MAKNAAQHIVPDDELDELIDGLRQPEKMISPKYFYDERGSQLFEEITRLPEYYPTETELGIMRDNVGEIAALVGKQASLIEFGSGSSLKTRVLLENLDELAAYVPVDISEDHLLESAQQIREDFPKLDVLPVVADFTQPFQLPSPKIMPVRNIVYFPGSTIGNFTHDAAHELLQVMHEEAGAYRRRPAEGSCDHRTRLQRQRRRDGGIQPQHAAAPEPRIRRGLRPGRFRAQRRIQ
jgi:uncharacterized SAM-dependent methyltransferase